MKMIQGALVTLAAAVSAEASGTDAGKTEAAHMHHDHMHHMHMHADGAKLAANLRIGASLPKVALSDAASEVRPLHQLAPVVSDLAVGDEVCITGFVMDNYCIYDTGGVLLDAKDIKTLENPELHSFYCLLDVGICFNSGFQVLGAKDEDTGLHCPGFRLDDTEAVLAAGRARGKKGTCSTCSGDASSPDKGYAATIKGTLAELGDGSDTAAGPPLLTNIQVLGESVGCDGNPTIPPLCAVSTAPVNNCIEEFCVKQLSDDYLLQYRINVPDGTTADVCDGCTISMELTYNGEAWVSFSFSSDGQMIGSEAVLGLPDKGKVEKYSLGGKSPNLVTPMPESQQTLTGTSIEVLDGKTVMKFTKIMKEAGEIEISTGDNKFLWALGADNTFGYHTGGRSSFDLNLSDGAPLEEPKAPTSAPEPETPAVPVGPAKDCTKEFCENQVTLDYLIQYKINVPGGTTLDACDGCTISMEITYNGEAWISVAFSKDGQMIGSEAVIGLPDGPKVEKYNLGGKIQNLVTPMPEGQQTLTGTSIEVVGGKTVMKFTKIMKEAGEIEISTGDNTFLWAHGASTTLGIHTGRAAFQLNLSSGASEAVAVPNKSAWLAHGIMAFCAWGVFVPFAVQSSLLRDLLPNGPLWFKLHKGLNSAAYAFFIIIFFIAVAFTSQEQGAHFKQPHQQMGLAMFILASFQVAWGVFRPHVPEEGEEKPAARTAFEVGHRVLGVSLLACGFWQIDRGIELFAGKYSVSESAEGNLAIAYWVWIGIMSALIILGGGYFKLVKSGD